MILSLDLGTNTGWAVSQNGLVTSGTMNFKPGRFEGGGMRFVRFTAWLEELSKTPIEAIYFEEVRRHMGVDAAHCYGGFMAHLSAFGDRRSIPYQGVPVATIKRHATGKGNAKKEAMIASVESMGYTPKDDNEADAIALLDFAIKTYWKHAA